MGDEYREMGHAVEGVCRNCRAAIVWVQRGVGEKSLACDQTPITVVSKLGVLVDGRRLHEQTHPGCAPSRRPR